MRIEIRLLLVIDAITRFAGMPLACCAGFSLQPAKQLVDSTAAASGFGRGPLRARVTADSWRRPPRVYLLDRAGDRSAAFAHFRMAADRTLRLPGAG